MFFEVANSAEAKRTMEQIAKRSFPALQRGLKQISGEFLLHIKETRLKGRGNVFDGEQGLIRRTGNLTRQLNAQTAIRESGTTADDLQVRFGVFDQKTLQYARVHELGTVGKGGSLPDIVPRRAKFLKVPIRNTGTAARPTVRGKVVGFLSLKKVSIPPRFKFHKSWEWWYPRNVPKILEAIAARITGQKQ